MRNVATFLDRHGVALLVFCSALFGMAWGLGHERDLIPAPWWFTPALQRFCLILMAWTALLHADPLQKLFWSITDFVALTLPYFAGILLVPNMELPSLIDFWVWLGKVSAAAVFGVAMTQAVYSLLPGWWANWESRKDTAEEQRTAAPEITPPSADVTSLLAALTPAFPIQEQPPMHAYYIDEPLSETEAAQVIDELRNWGETVSTGLEFRRIPFVFPVEDEGFANDFSAWKLFEQHLRNAGVRNGPSCVFIMPKDGVKWALMLQCAFERVAGHLPYVVQPWLECQSGQVVRREWMNVVDMSAFGRMRPVWA